MSKKLRDLLFCLLMGVLVACQPAPPDPETIAANVNSQVETAVAQTQVAPVTPSLLPPTVSITPASPPTASAPADISTVTPAPHQYVSSIRTTHAVTVDLVTNLQTVIEIVNFQDIDWVTEVTDYAALLHANAQTLQQLSPPANRRHFHERITAVTNDCDETATTLVQAARDANIILLQSVHSQWQTCITQVTEIEVFLDNFGQGGQTNNQTNGSQETANNWFTPLGCAGTSAGLIPLTDLGSGNYEGASGGLYPNGANVRPPAHEAAGLAIAANIEPLNGAGEVDQENGRIVLLSIGMSNTAGEFRKFAQFANSQPEKDPQVLVVNGAQPGGVARRMVSNDYDYWSRVDNSLTAAGASAAQVQVIWLKEADPAQNETFLEHAQRLEEELKTLVQLLQQRFPNLKMLYLSSRTYGGYATTRLNPEPYAYQTGFAVKWLIEAQINGDAALNFDPAKGEVYAPWLSWGPYLWADGLTPRSDGLTWVCSDFLNDGTHPGPGARDKVVNLLWHFFLSDSSTQDWFLSD